VGYIAGVSRNYLTRYPTDMATLTEMRVRGAKLAAKPYKLFDERGLLMPNCKMSWPGNCANDD